MACDRLCARITLPIVESTRKQSQQVLDEVYNVRSRRSTHPDVEACIQPNSASNSTPFSRQHTPRHPDSLLDELNGR